MATTLTKLIPFALLLCGGIVLTSGDIVMKQWVATDKKPFFFIGLAVYLVGLVFLSLSFKYKNIAIASVLLVIFNVSTLLLVSWLFYHETLSTWQVVGLLLGLAAVVILELSD